MATRTTGAEALILAARTSGANVWFANPGTTELPLVGALDKVTGIRAILCLAEGVSAAAADGFARVARRPAITLSHLGPSFANSIAALHNARRARSPIVNVVGDHPASHAAFDPPLNCDIPTLAGTVSSWVRRVQTPAHIVGDTIEAVAAAQRAPGGVATLIVPADCQRANVGAVTPAESVPTTRPAVSVAALTAAADALRSTGRNGALLLGGDALRETELVAAGRIAARTGCRLLCETFPAALDCSPFLPPVERVPYFSATGRAFFAEISHLVIVGTREPVSYFVNAEETSAMVPDGVTRCVLAAPGEDVAGALAELVNRLDASRVAPIDSQMLGYAEAPAGKLTPRSLAMRVKLLQPEGTIFIDEGVSAAGGYLAAECQAASSTYMTLTGGALGLALPCAVGAAVAAPDRRIVAFAGDGAAMYSVQALWTQAREQLSVINIIWDNAGYAILRGELARDGITIGPQAERLTLIRHPEIDWVSLAKSMGVQAERVSDGDQFSAAFARALAAQGPHVIVVRAVPPGA